MTAGFTGFARRTMALARTEILHVVRDRATLSQLILAPIIQLLILSNVATFTIRNSPVFIVDFDRTSVSRGLVSRLSSSGFFRIVGESSSPADADEAMLQGQATLVVTIPPEFEVGLRRSGQASLHLDVNSEKGSAASVVQSYVVQIVNSYANELRSTMRPSMTSVRAASRRAPRAGEGAIVMRVRHWYNPTLNYKHYMVPGLLVTLVTMIGTLITAQNIAREKEIGTLEQLNVTPLTKAEFITAKLLPFWVLGLVNLLMGLLIAVFVYDVPVRGNPLLLFFSAGIYLVVALGIGLWVSTSVDTQQQAMFVTFFILMIYLLMSGLFTPIDSMPRWVQLLSELNPVRHFVMISRAILVKGAGIGEIARPLAFLSVYAVAVLFFAIRQHHKTTA
jgi:ABC-type multidrug transport system permease subunit